MGYWVDTAIFCVFRENPARKTNVLKLEMSGRFAINVVDSLVVVHHQASKVTIATVLMWTILSGLQIVYFFVSTIKVLQILKLIEKSYWELNSGLHQCGTVPMY